MKLRELNFTPYKGIWLSDLRSIISTASGIKCDVAATHMFVMNARSLPRGGCPSVLVGVHTGRHLSRNGAEMKRPHGASF